MTVSRMRLLARRQLFAVNPVAMLALVTIGLPGTGARAQDSAVVTQVVAAIERTLPAGWSMDRPPPNDPGNIAGRQLPQTHWDCRNYHGPRGTMVEAVGPTAIEVEWETESGESGSTPVTRESLKVWVMPADYRKDFAPLSRVLGFLRFCERGDGGPTRLYKGPEAIVYGVPSMLYRKDSVYDEIFRKARRKLAFVASPSDDPSRLSWASWAEDLEAALRIEFPK